MTHDNDPNLQCESLILLPRCIALVVVGDQRTWHRNKPNNTKSKVNIDFFSVEIPSELLSKSVPLLHLLVDTCVVLAFKIGFVVSFFFCLDFMCQHLRHLVVDCQLCDFCTCSVKNKNETQLQILSNTDLRIYLLYTCPNIIYISTHVFPYA